MPPAREVEFEVLPKGTPPPRHAPTGGARADDPLVAFFARLMDSIFTVPGTRIKFGLDPIIGLLPGLGSGANAVVSLLLIARSATQGVPTPILARMLGNVIINAILDTIPVAGDVLSVFYRSNARNYELLQQHAGTRKKATARDWLILGGLFLGVIAIIVCLLVGMLAVVGYVVRTVTGG
jgi:hypothetical protein